MLEVLSAEGGSTFWADGWRSRRAERRRAPVRLRSEGRAWAPLDPGAPARRRGTANPGRSPFGQGQAKEDL